MHRLNSPRHRAALRPPCSPPESENSLSTFSTSGSASSLSFQDTSSCNGVIGELSPSSVGSKESKSGLVSPVRLSFQELQLGSKMHTFGYSKSAHTTPQKTESHGGRLHERLLELGLENGRVAKRHALLNRYPDCKATCLGAIHQHCDAEEYEGRGRQERGSFVRGDNPITREAFANPKTSSSSITGCEPYCMVPRESVGASKEQTLSTGASEACADYIFSGEKTIFFSDPPCSHEVKEGTGCEYSIDYGSILMKNANYRRKADKVNAYLREKRCMLTENDGHDGLLQQPSTPKGGPPKASDRYGTHPCSYVDSCADGYRNTHKYVQCVLERGSSPYDTEIGIDIASLKHLPDLMTPCKEVSLSRALSLHQSPYTYGRPPLAPTPKLNNTPCSPGSKEALQRKSFTGFSSDANGSPARYSKRRQIKEGAYASSLKTRGFSKTSFSVHSNEDAAKIANELCIGSSRIGYNLNSSVEHSSVSCFLPIVKKNAQESTALIQSGARHDGESTTDSPTTMARRKWRSRSLGERASLKSTARNLEAAFSGFKSASMHKTSSCIAKDVSKDAAQLGDSKSTDIVSVSSIDGHRDQPCRLVFSDRSLDRQCYANEDMVPCTSILSRKATSSTDMHLIACAPRNLVVKPSAPIAHKRRRHKLELLCKPLLPVAQSIYLLPSSKGALRSELPCSSGYSLQWFPPDMCKATSLPCKATSPPVMLQASVQCTSTDGLSCFTMSMEGAEDMLMAKDCRPQTPSSTGPTWLCTFYSGKVAGKGPRAGGWRRWTKRENKAALDLIGIMQVSNVYKSNGLLAMPLKDCSLSLEFVLYDGKAHPATHSQSLRICPKDMPSHKTSVPDFSTEGVWLSSHCAIRSRLSHQGNSETEHMALSTARGASLINGSSTLQTTTTPVKDHVRHRPTYSLDGCSDSEFTDSDSHVQDPSLLSHLELAAIVIRTSLKRHHTMLNVVDDLDDTGGWGLKFLNGGAEADKGRRVLYRNSLNDVTMDDSSTSMEPAHCLYKEHKPLLDSSRYVCSRNAESMTTVGNGKTSKLGMEVNVAAVKQSAFHHEETESSDCLALILPSGDHNLPSAGMKRPSSLIERWESGGSCECGGWDLGCGIEVLSSGKPGAISHENTSPVLSHDQPISIFSQGSRNELMFSLSCGKEGQYNLKFHEKLSQLRAFATAVAILHGRQTASISLSTSTSTSTPTSTLTLSSSSSSS